MLMKYCTCCLLFLIFCPHAFGQTGEIDKFYTFYKIPNQEKGPYASVYSLIEKRRADFSEAISSYREKNNGTDGFIYNPKNAEIEILTTLRKMRIGPLKELVYYSYFDLGFGIYGIPLNNKICVEALREIKPNSVIWAMEPTLFEAVIKASGGEDKNGSYINELLKQNKDETLKVVVKNSLSSNRALKKGKELPDFTYVRLDDTTITLSSKKLRGKYYLIDIWATWCKPCIDELPILKKEFKIVDKQNIDFISISIDNNVTLPIKFLKEKIALPWTTGISIPRSKLMNALMINGIPCTILIDPQGKILSYGYELRGVNLHNTISKIIY